MRLDEMSCLRWGFLGVLLKQERSAGASSTGSANWTGLRDRAGQAWKVNQPAGSSWEKVLRRIQDSEPATKQLRDSESRKFAIDGVLPCSGVVYR
jgi:hypothetical protein